MVICSARRHGHQAAAAQIPHIQLVDVTLVDTADAATYAASNMRRSASTGVRASGTSKVTDPSMEVSGTASQNMALDVEQASSVNTIASDCRVVIERAIEKKRPTHAAAAVADTKARIARSVRPTARKP
jgi:hypothetical protein